MDTHSPQPLSHKANGFRTTRQMWPAAVVLLLFAGGCHHIPPPEAPEDTRVVVFLPDSSLQEAVRRVLEAMFALGLTPDTNEGGIVTTQLVDLPGAVIYAKYQVTVFEVDGGCRAIVTGTVLNEEGAAMYTSLTGIQTDAAEFPLHSKMWDEPLAGAWATVVDLAKHLSGGSS